MKPGFTITAGNEDITAKLRDRMISLRVIDVAGWRSDEASFILDMRDGKLAVPPLGAQLKVQLGYPDQGLWLTGSYKVDSLDVSGPPAKMEIIARATDFLGPMKAPTSYSWHQKTIGEIVSQIADWTNLTATVAKELADIPIPHIDQTAESYMHFLTRLSRDYGAIFKVANDRLLFLKAGVAQSAAGLPLPAVSIGKTDIINWRYGATGRNRFDGVKARWRDIDANVGMTYVAGFDGDVVKELPFGYPTAAAAKAAADAAFEKLQRREEKLELTIVGNPAARAMFPVTVDGLGKPLDSADWLIQRAEHDYSSKGLISRLTLEKKNR